MPTDAPDKARAAALPTFIVGATLALIWRYLSELLIDVNLVLSLLPRPFTTAMIASAMPAAIRPYSMAVAPDSSAKNARMVFTIPKRRRWALIPNESIRVDTGLFAGNGGALTLQAGG